MSKTISIVTDNDVTKDRKNRTEIVCFREEDDGWYVNTENIDDEGWRRYAIPEVKERDVQQLLRKEYSVLY